MEAVPRLPMISCDIKISPSNTDFGHVLKKYIRDHYHEDQESYTKEIKELETLRQNAIKAPMDFTGCSILKRYYSQLHKLQSRFPMTDDGPACVPFMWTDIYSGVAYNITDIEYEEACILYNIGALHSKLGTMDSRCNAEGMKIACTHFQCAAWAFQHLRDTYPQPKGSDMSHDLLTFFINIMLAQAQECILEKSMLDSRKSSITAKIAAQVVDYYKCALGIMVSGSPSTDTGSILDIVGSKIFKGWKKFIEFKMSYYTSISHLYMGNQAEENEKWGERVAWFQSAYDHLTEAFKIAKNIDREDLNEPLTFTMDVIGGKHNSSKKENEFVYHDKVPALSSLPELKGASLVKGIPFSITDPDVCGPDIFGRLVPMEAHETSSLYSEEKAKLLRSMVAKIEGKNEELMAYLSSLQLEEGLSFQEEEKIPQMLLEKCAAMSVRPNAISDLRDQMKELLGVSRDVDSALKSASSILSEEEKKELLHQENFGKRVPSMIIVELKKECSKYDEAHRKAIESNNTLESLVNIHLSNMSKLLLPLEELAAMLPSITTIKSPENVKAVDDFNHLVDKVEEMRKQRQFLEQQLRDSLIKDDITKNLVTMKKKEDLQKTFSEELKKHSETLTYLDQNLSAQDNILCALTEANAHYAETRKALTEIKHQRNEMMSALVVSFEIYEDLVSKAKNGLEFYQKLQSNVTRLLTRVRSVTKVQDEERSQFTNAEFRKGPKLPKIPNLPPETQTHVPKLKDYLPYMTKQGGAVSVPAGLLNYPPPQHAMPPTTQFVSEPMRQATLGGPATADFNRKLKPVLKENIRTEDNFEVPSMGVRPTPVGSEQTSVSAMCTTAVSNTQVGNFPYSTSQQWAHLPPSSGLATSPYDTAYIPYQYPSSSQISPMSSSSINSPSGMPASNVTYSQLRDPNSVSSQNYSSNVPTQNGFIADQYTAKSNFQQPISSVSASQSTSSIQRYGTEPGAVAMSQVNGSFVPGISAPGTVGSSAVSQSPSVSASSASPAGGVPGSNSVYPSVGYNASSSQQSVGFPPGSSITSPGIEQNQMHPHWQGNMQMGQYTPTSGYNSQGPVYDQTQAPNMNTYQPTPPVQYYQTNPQLSVSSVTASMDTRTSTSRQHSASNPNAYMYPPQLNSVGYSMNQSDTTRTFTNARGNSENVNMQTQYYGQTQNYNPSMQTKFSNSSNLPPSTGSIYATPTPYAYQTSYGNTAIPPNQISYGNTSIPHQNTYGNTPVPSNQNTYGNTPVNPNQNSYGNAAAPSNQSIYYQYPSEGTSFAPNSSFTGTVANMPTTYVPAAISTTVSPINVNQPPNSTFHNSAVNSAFVNQQNYQPPSNSINQYNHTVPNVAVAPNSSFSAPNQQFQVPVEAKPAVPCQPLHPSPSTVPQSRPEVKSPARSLDVPAVPEGSHLNAIRDLITPPLEKESTNAIDSAEKETCQVLQPKVIDLKSLSQMKEKESGYLVKDPLDDSSVRAKFVSEVEKYEKFVEGLVRKSLNGTTPLDQKWKELIDAQDKESRKMSISVARCYPLKNRFPDVMPYDNNRVKLVSAKDDYVNASYLKDICPSSPVFVISQAPLPATFNDFWLMVWEQQVETLICLLPDGELKNHVYFPKERGPVLPFGAFETSLHSYKEKNGFVERMINITHIKNRTSRVVVHLQFTQWPVSGIPQSPAPLLQFISDVLSYQKQQRNLLRPVVVHCSAGIGRSGCFCLITALVNEMNSGHGPRDIAQVVMNVSQQRKFLIQDKEQLKFCYDTVLYYAQDLLMKRGILTTRASFDNKLPGSGSSSSHVRHPSEDFILGSGGLAKLQSGMEKMGLTSDNPNTVTAPVEITLNSSPPQDGSGDIPTENVIPDQPEVVLENSEKSVETVESEVSKDDTKTNIDKNLPFITSLLDPLNFTLDGTGSPAKRKITKENFATSKGSLSTSSSDSADPLSQLDPLWSLKK